MSSGYDISKGVRMCARIVLGWSSFSFFLDIDFTPAHFMYFEAQNTMSASEMQISKIL